MHPVSLQRLQQATISPFKKYLHPSTFHFVSFTPGSIFFNVAPWLLVSAFVIQIPGAISFYFNDLLLNYFYTWWFCFNASSSEIYPL